MDAIRVSLFGNMKVVHENCQCELKLTRTIELLLAYLLLERNRLHTREKLAALFWGELSQDRSRNCLNTALWRLRHALELDGASQSSYLITSHSGDVGFNTQCEYWLDVAVFEANVSHVLKLPIESISPQDVQELENGLDLYTGDLLESVYDDWALHAREHKRMLYLGGLAYLLRYYHMHGLFLKSLAFGKQILSIDPLREEIHREMMRLYVECGDRALAVRQYELCRQTLYAELGIPPMEETEALFLQIIQRNSGDALPADEPVNLRSAMEQLKQANHHIELASEQFRRAIHYLEKQTRKYQ